jgi:glyoxylase-like metal-dependent hydrolase (beta-lactamase superfamily II)
MMQPAITPFFDNATNTITYLVVDPVTALAAVIDPVMDYDPRSGKARHTSAKEVLAEAERQGATIALILETHVHADHLTAAPWFKARTGAQIVIGAQVDAVQRTFAPVFGASDVSGSGAEFDRLVEDGAVLELGTLKVEVIHTPGHTPACVSYRIGDDVFVGDTLFMPDYGTARADFPGGDARQLYRSIRRLLALPPETRLWMCHDYKAPGRDSFAWQTSVAAERAGNVHIHDGVTEDEFAAARTARDKTLAAPVLLLPSVQVNMRAGHLPPPDGDGAVRLRIPMSVAD